LVKSPIKGRDPGLKLCGEWGWTGTNMGWMGRGHAGMDGYWWGGDGDDFHVAIDLSRPEIALFCGSSMQHC